MSDLVGRRPHGRGDGVGKPVPGGRFLAEPPASSRCQRVVLRLAVVVARAPLGRDQCLVLESIKGGVKDPCGTERALPEIC